jgi:hypothetical protein
MQNRGSKKNMAVEQSNTFNFPAPLCYDTLLEALKGAQLTVKSQDAQAHSLVAYWIIGMVQFTITAECSPAADQDATTVNLIYRTDLTPMLKRPGIKGPLVENQVKQKMQLIFNRLDQSLGITSEVIPLQAFKLKRLTKKWMWYEWVIFFTLSLPILLLLSSTKTDTSSFDLIFNFIAAVCLWSIYNMTLRKLWLRLWPQRYTEWACSNCNTIVPETTTTCPSCNLEFGDK